MTKTLIIAVMLLFTGLNNISAHALWIETSSAGKVGTAQHVKLFYGEYASNERENISKWYSDVKDCSLWLIGPGNEKTQLETTLDSNFASASFTPQNNGVYTLLVSHKAKELSGTTMYGFLASAIVNVGPISNNVKPSINTNELMVIAHTLASSKVNAPIKLTALLADSTKASRAISIFSPSGWSKEIITDASGTAAFTPLWPGRYVAEVTDYQKITGEHNGKNYAAVWKGATYCFEVVK